MPLTLSSFLKRAEDATEPDGSVDYRGSGHLGRNLLMAGAASAPWLGAIGEKRVRHQNQNTHSVDQLHANAAPGDVFLVGKEKFNDNKAFISLASPVPDGYRVMLAGNNGELFETAERGVERHLGGLKAHEAAKNHHIMHLRPKMSPGEVQHQLDRMNSFERAAQRFNGAVASAAAPGDVERQQRIKNHVANANYGEAGIPSLIREMYLPKLLRPATLEANKAEAFAARETLGANIDAFAQTAAKNINAGDAGRLAKLRNTARSSRLNKMLPPYMQLIPEFASGALDHALPECAKGVCSSLPATMLPEGRYVVPGKLPQRIIPATTRARSSTTSSAPTPRRRTTLCTTRFSRTR